MRVNPGIGVTLILFLLLHTEVDIWINKPSKIQPKTLILKGILLQTRCKSSDCKFISSFPVRLMKTFLCKSGLGKTIEHACRL